MMFMICALIQIDANNSDKYFLKALLMVPGDYWFLTRFIRKTNEFQQLRLFTVLLSRELLSSIQCLLEAYTSIPDI